MAVFKLASTSVILPFFIQCYEISLRVLLVKSILTVSVTSSRPATPLLRVLASQYSLIFFGRPWTYAQINTSTGNVSSPCPLMFLLNFLFSTAFHSMLNFPLCWSVPYLNHPFIKCHVGSSV